MTNDFVGGILTGVALAVVTVAVFQIGINIGLKTCINMLDGNYPAAMNYLKKHNNEGKILPYVIGSGHE